MLLSPHDPNWSREFSALKAVLTNALHGRIERIEHVGSTAIPGLLAKPILDIDVVMTDYGTFPAIILALAQLGYRHNGDQGIPEREAFKRHDPEVPWTEPRKTWMEHHLYVCPATGAELRRHVRFRNVLRVRPDLRDEYERMKLAINAQSGDDRQVYATIKDTVCRDFVERVLKGF